MGELAVAAVDRSPLLGDGQDLGHLPGGERVHGDAAGSTVLERADLPPALTPVVHAVIGDAQQSTHPGVRPALRNGVVHEHQDRRFRLGPDPHR